jgi:hypothetical protein
MLRDRSHRSMNGNTSPRRRTGRTARCVALLGVSAASVLGTLTLASAPASAAVSISGLGSVSLSTVLAPVTTLVSTLTNTTATDPGCPVALPAPSNPGGIGNIFPLIPFFGPFSAEAFVWLPLLQTLVPTAGPLLPVLQNVLVSLQPEINALLPIVESLEANGFAVISPAYAPYRAQVLSAEAQLVQLLLPLAQQGASLPGSPCLADVEGLIVTSLDQSAAAGALG